MRSLLLLMLPMVSGCQSALDAEQVIVDSASSSPTTVEDWLLKREELCQLPNIERRARLKLYGDDRSRNEAYRMERLMLASCAPDQTPGQMFEALAALPENPSWPPAQKALIEMVRDYAKSYRMLEQQKRDLERKLEDTINGIQKIEAEIDDMQSNGVVR
ncbi:MAG: hypothetical protein AAB834_01030 [Patescibacteria group bacterium]